MRVFCSCDLITLSGGVFADLIIMMVLMATKPVDRIQVNYGENWVRLYVVD